MAQFEKKFGKYLVSLDTDMGDGATGCWIEYKTVTRHFSSSLQCAQDTGQLEDYDKDSIHAIDSRLLDDIEEWATENGY